MGLSGAARRDMTPRAQGLPGARWYHLSFDAGFEVHLVIQFHQSSTQPSILPHTSGCMLAALGETFDGLATYFLASKFSGERDSRRLSL